MNTTTAIAPTAAGIAATVKAAYGILALNKPELDVVVMDYYFPVAVRGASVLWGEDNDVTLAINAVSLAVKAQKDIDVIREAVVVALGELALATD